MRRFAIAAERLLGGRVAFDRDESRHLARVLRLRPGDTVIAADGAGHDYTVRLETVNADEATGTVLGVATARADPRFAITLVQGVPKGDKMELIVRAVTELGIARVVPAITERTVVRLDAPRWRERARRWQRVAKEAAKQCGRAVIPAVEPPLALDQALDLVEPAALKLVLWEGEAPALERVLDGAGGAPPPGAVVLIGPEGGLALSEVDAARARGWKPASLGPRILRTETAGPAIIAILQHRFGDLGAEQSRAAPVSGHPPSDPASRTPLQ